MPIKIIIIILENMECEQKNLKWCDPYAVENKTVLHEKGILELFPAMGQEGEGGRWNFFKKIAQVQRLQLFVLHAVSKSRLGLRVCRWCSIAVTKLRLGWYWDTGSCGQHQLGLACRKKERKKSSLICQDIRIFFAGNCSISENFTFSCA